jgi:hypothetical protein
MTYFYDPGRWVMLVLGLFFVLYGGLYFFWWWHVLSWQTFWQSTNYLLPALLVTTGIFFLFRRR